MAPSEIPASLLATGRGIASAMSGAISPPLIAGQASSVWASSFLLMAAISACSPWIAGPYNMHATALNALAEWGRVHEVRRPSMPKLGALIQIGLAGLRYSPRWPGRLLDCCSLHRFPGVARCTSTSARSEGYPAGSVCSSTLVPLDAFCEGARRMASSWPVPELAWGSNLLLALCRCRDRSARFPSM